MSDRSKNIRIGLYGNSWSIRHFSRAPRQSLSPREKRSSIANFAISRRRATEQISALEEEQENMRPRSRMDMMMLDRRQSTCVFFIPTNKTLYPVDSNIALAIPSSTQREQRELMIQVQTKIVLSSVPSRFSKTAELDSPNNPIARVDSFRSTTVAKVSYFYWLCH